MEFWQAVIEFEFLQHAIWAGLLASVACGLMGPFIIVKRIGYLAGGISHSALGGMGIALFLGSDPMWGAVLMSLFVASLVAWISLSFKQQEDTLISAIWAVGMALGVLFIAKTPGYSVDLVTYLFGNVLLVPKQALWMMFGLDAVVLVVVLLFHKTLVAVCFDEEFARTRSLPVTFFYLLLLWMVALTVVILIQVVGLILVIALLTLPSAVASLFQKSMWPMTLTAILLGMIFSISGIWLSYSPDLPAGATIILIAGGAYCLSLLASRWYMRLR